MFDNPLANIFNCGEEHKSSNLAENTTPVVRAVGQNEPTKGAMRRNTRFVWFEDSAFVSDLKLLSTTQTYWRMSWAAVMNLTPTTPRKKPPRKRKRANTVDQLHNHCRRARSSNTLMYFATSRRPGRSHIRPGQKRTKHRDGPRMKTELAQKRQINT